MKCRPDSAPNRLTAAAIAHRSAAQNGQYSPPMYSSSGFPPAVSSGCPVSAFRPVAAPAPTALKVAEGILVMWRATPGSATADAVVARAGGWSSLATMSPATSASTTATLPPVIRIRRRVSARRPAARCASIFALAFCSRTRAGGGQARSMAAWRGIAAAGRVRRQAAQPRPTP